MCHRVWGGLAAEASQSERRERLGVSKRTDIWWPQVLLPYLLVPGAPFISRLDPGPSGAGGKIKAARYSRAGQHMGLLCRNRAVLYIGPVKASAKHEAVGSNTGVWCGGGGGGTG